MAAPRSRRNAQARVLAVDDEVLNLELLERSLRRHYQVLTATSPSRALEVLAEEPDVAVILSDYRMPGMTGTELLGETVSSHPDTKRVIITGYADNDAVVRAADAGEVDYVIKKPWRHKQLHQLLQQFVQGYQLARENRSLFDNLREVNQELEVRDELYAATVDNDRKELVETTQELRRANRELEEMAYRDSVTGLYKRRAFIDRLREEMARGQRYEHPVSLLYGDIDQLAALNHSQGRDSGDQALCEVARLMTADAEARVRESDIVGRLAGEEFGIILVETDRSGAAIKAARLREAIARTHLPGSHQLTISFGMACAPGDGSDAERLMANAQRALTTAKRSGRNRQALYSPPADNDGARYGDMRGRATTASEALGDGAIAPSIPVIGTGAFRMLETCAQEVGKFGERVRALSALYVDMSPLDALQPLFGRAWHAMVHEQVGATLSAALGEDLDPRDVWCRTARGDFMCLLTPARTPGTEARDPDELAQALGTRLSTCVEPHLARHLRAHGLPAAVAVRVPLPRSGPAAPEGRRDVAHTLRALAHAGRERLRHQIEGRRHERCELLVQHLADELLGAHYQPIVSLDTADIFGYRASLHGPRHSPLESPEAIALTVASSRPTWGTRLIDAVARTRMQRSLADAHDLDPTHRLFVTLHPSMLYDTALMQARIDEFFLRGGLGANSLVLSVSERAAQEQFTELRRALAVYSSQGFGIAVHDVGQRCDLSALLMLEPHFIELSPNLIRGLGRIRGKREIVRSLVGLAHTIDALCIAPALDSADDLHTLVGIGVPYGRGSFLCRPGPPFPRLRAPVKRTLDNLLNASHVPTPAPPADDPELATQEPAGTDPARGQDGKIDKKDANDPPERHD